MITQDKATAKILFLLASDNRSQVQALSRDLQRSRYRYFLSRHSDKATLVESVRRQIAENDGRLPVVLVVSYKFARKDCHALVELARITAGFSAIACVVTQPPSLASQREALVALGARLFDGEDDLAMSEVKFH